MNQQGPYQARDAMSLLLKKGPMRIVAIIVAIFFILSFSRPWVQVGAGQRGVVMNFGAVQEKVLAEGIHLRIPIMQEIVLVDVKVQKVETDAAAASSDLQDVTSRVALNYHIVPDKANVVYQSISRNALSIRPSWKSSRP
jgi:prohibitin 2